MANKNLFFVGAVLLVLIGAGDAYLYQQNQGTEEKPALKSSAEITEGAHVIVLTKDGFKPDQLTIQKGETVAFTNTTGELFWPASNLHPSHLVYPEFDPQEPVPADGVWSFTFDKAGEWKFHDHLAPYYTGVITVTE